MKTFTAFGNKNQASVMDTQNIAQTVASPYPLRFGVIVDVYTPDDKRNITGSYTMYSVALTPSGQIIRNVPTSMCSGHNDWFDKVPQNALPEGAQLPIDTQNSEETPYKVGQPVLIGFVSASYMNPIIICPASSILNSSSQTKDNYPQKTGSFQGLTWSVDKTGNPSMVIPQTGNLTIYVGSNDPANLLLTISAGSVIIGPTATSQPGVLGDALKSFLDNVFNGTTGHTHTNGNGGAPTGPPIGILVPTTVLKVN